MELIKKHEEFEKRMNANDDKINQMMHFSQRLNEENHYASDKIMEKACLLYTSPSPRDA